VVVIPKGLRETVMTMAHDAVISGHQGQKKTKDRIWREFWWPGFGAEITRFCRSCDICQRTIAKGRVPSVPLGKMPIIDTPFDRVAVDLFGPIFPPTERGSKLAARYNGSWPGVQSASLYHNFRKPGNYVIMTSLMTS